MANNKRIAYIEEVEKMKGLKAGQSANIKFRGSADIVNIVYKDNNGYEVEKEKHHFPITLLSHPEYPHLEGSEGTDMVWETVAAEAIALNGALPEMANASDKANRGIVKHFDTGLWEIQCRDDGKIKLWMVK
tara:strand:+ start:289 stop:684 length:396 start_codon:yes stop_codon:yes gene_type:complete